MAPELGLHYNSNGADGQLGVGWSLKGVSQIRRCRESWARDGRAERIDFDAIAFCLDGEPLIVKTRLGSLVEYRTAQDRFALISSDGGSSPSKPTRFYVYQRDGRIYEYGGTADSAPQVGTTTGVVVPAERLVWALSAIVDRSGNTIDFSYGGASGDFEQYLTDIKYTGSRSGENKYWKQLRRVHFDYEDRTSPVVRYVDHRPESSSVRLKKITSYLKASPTAAEETVSSYELDYGGAPSEETNRSLLRSVSWCDANGACLKPTAFDYAEAALDQPYALTYSAPLSDRPDKTVWTRLLVMDLNGDGGDDVIYTLVHPNGKSGVGTDTDVFATPHRRVFAILGSGYGIELDITNAFYPLPLNDPWALLHPFRSRPGDFDGDGKSELMVWGAHREGSRYGHRIYGWDSDANTLVPKLGLNHNPPPGILSHNLGSSMTLDLNGDGALDFVASDGTGGSHYYRLGTPGTLNLGEATLLGIPQRRGACALPPWGMDTDNDGRAELLEGCENSGYINSYGLDKAGTPETTARADEHGLLPGFGKWDIVLVDVNGDGLKDALYHSGSQGQRFEIRINTGRAFLPPYEAVPELSGVGRNFEADHMRIGDFNGDGLEDLMLLEAGAKASIEDSSLIYRYTEAPEILLSDGSTFWRAPDDMLGAQTIPRLKHWAERHSHNAGWATTQLADVDGDGVPEVVTIDKANGEWRLNTYSRRVALGPSPAASRDRLIKVSPGQGLTEQISYEPILGGNSWRDHSIYRPGTTCKAPEYCVKRGFVVVAELNRKVPGDDSSAGQQTLQYSYEDGRAHTRGYGFLGFSKISERELGKNRETITTYNITRQASGSYETYPALGVPLVVEENHAYITPDGIPTLRRAYRKKTWSSQLHSMAGPGSPYSSQSYFRAVSNLSIVEDWVSEGANTGATLPVVLHKRTDLTNYDEYGNWRSQVTVNDGGERTTIIRTIDNDAANWLIGQVRTETATSSPAAPSTLTDTHTTHYDYWPTTGLLKSRIIEPNDTRGAEKLTISHIWKSGMLIALSQTDGAGEWRPRAYHYDAEGVFPIAIVTELGHSTRLSWYRGIGKMESAAAPDLVTDRWEYDGFGRLTADIPAGAAATRIGYAASAAPSVKVNGVTTTLSEQVTTTVDSTTQVARTYLDTAGRPVLRRWLDFAGVGAQQHQRFDVYGRPIVKTNAVKAPAQAADGTIAASTAPKSIITFDVLDRPISLTFPDGTNKTITYPTFFTRTERDAKLDATTTTFNPDGRVKEVVTGASALTRTYGPFGRPLTDNYGTKIKATIRKYSYDRRERLKTSTEFALQRRYNAFDEVVEERRGEVTTKFRYDKMGRVLEMEGINEDRTDDFTGFVYDEGPHALGKLSRAFSGPAFALEPGNEAPVSSYSSFSYDEFGRLKQKMTGTEYGEDALDFTYDAAGRLDTMLYPHQGPAAARFGIKYGYNAVGYLQTIKNSATLGLYWQVTARTPDGLLSGEKYGNSVVRTHQYDPNMRWLKGLNAKRSTTVLQDLAYTYHVDGNLATRSDSVTSVMDTFGYDSDDRLTQWTRSGAASLDRVYAYNPDGGLRSVTNDYFSDGSPKAVRNFMYAGSSDLSATTTLRSDGEFDYRYDASGRQTSRRLTGTATVSRRIDYTSFDLPKRVESGGVVTVYSYDAFQQRMLKRTATSVTRYFDDLYERRSDVDESPASVVNVYRVMGESGPVAQVTRAADDTSKSLSVSYLHNDALGSVAVVTNSSGVVQERLDYEPFGRRISRDGVPTLPSGSSVKVGFTGHEHDDEHGLISMRGRMYDPSIRRFVTPDPVVQDPLNPQSYNPFTYVLNNPLRLIDPTGFWGEDFQSGAGTENDPYRAEAIVIVEGGRDSAPQARAGGGMEEPKIEAALDPGGQVTGGDFVAGRSDGTHDSAAGPVPPSPGPSGDQTQEKTVLEEVGQGAIDIFIREPVCAVFGCGPAVGSVGGSTRKLSETEKVLQSLAYFGTGAVVGSIIKRTVAAVTNRAATKIAAKVAARGLVGIPGRVATRINLSNAGMKHVRDVHLNPAKAINKSQWFGSEATVRGLLSAKSTIQSPVRLLDSGNFARTVTNAAPVGTLPGKWGGGATNVFTVISDDAGNLLSAFPGTL